MKERMVIERNEDTSEYYKKFPNRSGKQIEHIEVLAPIEQNVRFEQVPETFEELKTMCEELESQTMDVTCDVLKDEIDVTIWNIDRSYKVGFAEFYYDGDKVHLFMGTGFSIPIEIPKVWAFIKSLIGEE